MVDFEDIVDKVEDNFGKGKKHTPKGTEETPPNSPKKKPNIYVVIGLVVVVIFAGLSVALHVISDQKKELETRLTEAEKKLELRDDVVAAITAENEGLQEQLEELFNIKDADPVITTDQLEEQLTAVRELITAKYIYTNASRCDDHKTWLGDWTMPFSNTTLLATYDGYIKAGLDLNKIKIDVKEETRTIVVTLPPCEITDNNIPQESIKVLEVKNNLFNSVSFEDYNNFIAGQKTVMETRAISQGLLTDANNEAKATVKAILSLIPGMDTYTLIVN